ncbi:unnamed protein product [Peronospora belbahrii]|uniref:Uncharacterized protein n=1 Tax=Peronospora belbahrii TaxID=622444 RepID=A0ABN8DCQ3_9STRA|nr:unnamed protein product [Peronospora belbahrii]
MHYVLSSAEDEKVHGMRVLVIGNVVVASSKISDQSGHDTQAEEDAANVAMVFDALTLRVEELRVRQTILEAQWNLQRVDGASMWKPRARHAHSSVVVGGEQVFVFGGKDATSSTFFNDIFYYDSSLNQWVKPTVSPTGQLPQPRAFAGLTASDDGNTLFLFGGTDGKQEFGSLFLYDVVHSRWDSLAGATLGDRPSCRINHSITFVAPCHLVLFGGRRRAIRENELFIYNVSTRVWRLVHGDPSNNRRLNRRPSSQASRHNEAPVGRTAHATVLLQADPVGLDAVQKLLVFGGYAGSHQWLDDLYLLALSQAVLTQPPSSIGTPSRSISATPESAACVALSALQQSLETHQSLQSVCLHEKSNQSVGLRQKCAPPIEMPQQLSESICWSRKQQPKPRSQPNPENLHREQSQSVLHSSTAPVAIVSSSPHQKPMPTRPVRFDSIKQAAAITAASTGSSVLSDITNHTGSFAQNRLQPSVDACIVGASNTKDGETLPGAAKKHKRRRLEEDNQERNNSNSSNKSGELTTMQLGIQTTLLQLLQYQPRVEGTLARILSMLTSEQIARRQQSMTEETLMRAQEQSKLLEAASRRNEVLEGRLAQSEAERALLHEKIMTRELYERNHSLVEAIPSLNQRVQTIESLHMQQLKVSRAIELKISAVHDFMHELRNTEGEGTETNGLLQQRLGQFNDPVTTQPTSLPPKPLLYPQQVVLALEEKVRVMELEKKLKVMAEKLKRIEGREAQVRQFFFSWCQGDNPAPAADVAVPIDTSTVPVIAAPIECESVNTGTDNMTNTADS